MSNRAKAIDGTRAEEILTAWVNLPDDLFRDQRPLARLTSRYPEIFRDPVGEQVAGSDFRWIAGIREHLRAAWDAPDQRARQWYIFKVRDLYATAARVHLNERIADSASKLRFAFSNKPGVKAENDDKGGVRVLRAEETASPGESVISLDESSMTDQMKSSRDAGAAFWRRITESGMLVYPPPPMRPFEEVMYHFQLRSHYALHCANPGCPAPYFFKEDGVRTQRYCGEDCSHVARLESKGKWWNEVGKAKRDAVKKKKARRESQ